MSRRSPGEGSISQGANGRWVVRLELPRGPSGHRRRKLRRARTRAEAVRKLREMRAELEDIGAVSDGRRTVGDAVETYGELLDQGARKPATKSSHDWMLGLIDCGLGWKRLADLTVADCDGFLDQAAAGLKPGSRRIGPDHLSRLRALLISVVRNEVRLGSVNRNVADLSRRPKRQQRRKRTKNRRALSRDDLRNLIEVADGTNLIAIDLIGRNGVRPAEARALAWSALDMERQLLTVELQMDADDDPDDVKTEGSHRTIRIDHQTIVRLQHWRDTQTEHRERYGERWTESGLVVTTRYGTAINRNNLLRSIKRLCEQAGITPPIVPYELRHTAISHQADAGRSSWEIADWAGSSERMIAETYRHQLKAVSDLTPAD